MKQSPQINNNKKLKINIHLIMGIVFLVVLLLIIFTARNWGNRISIEDFFSTNDSDTLADYGMDQFFPVLSKEDVIDDGELQILFLGNNELVADYGDEANITNIISSKIDATIYNCGIEDSYMTSMKYTYLSEIPIDAFSFYWLTTLFTVNNTRPISDALTLMDVSENTLTSLDLLQTIDFQKIDVIGIFYDASDYYAGRHVINNDNSSHISYFAGALTAGIELIRSTYPHIRIIVLSPTYAFGLDEHGDYASSEFIYYNEPLSNYVYAQLDAAYFTGTTFVDNLYGSINEDIASDYLIDHKQLSLKGRELIADRFIYALEYFN